MAKINKLVIASHNSGKIREIDDLLRPFSIEVSSALELGFSDVEETGTTFEENACLKAVETAGKSKTPALGDDSGLMVEALNGDPGIYTARWAQKADGSRDWNLAMSKVADKLRAAGTDNWRAKFVCVLALAFEDGRVIVERGEVAGTLVWPLRGDLGFGYDPMFVPDGYQQTFGEMLPAEKHEISHRHIAFQKILRHHLL